MCDNAAVTWKIVVTKMTPCDALPLPPPSPVPPPFRPPRPVPAAPKQMRRGCDVLKWDWRRVAECGWITGVFRQTEDRESN